MKFKGVRRSDRIVLYYIRKFPNHPFKIRIINWINDLVFNNVIKVKSRNEDVFAVSTREQIGHEIILSGCYEPLTLLKCEDLLRNGGVFIDIGANMGLHSIYLSKLKNISIYAVEPSIHNFQKLLFNIKLNGAKNINPVNIALSDKDSFGFLTNDSPVNSGTFKVVNNCNDTDSYLIRLCTLSELLNYFKISEVELLKIDIEGFEMNVFKGLFEHCSIMPKNIIMELSDLMERTGYTIDDCYDYLKNLGYDAYSITGDKYNLGDPLPEANLWLKKNN